MVDNPSPKYSIIIPVYNRERFIERAVQSVLDQKFRDLEVLCINNGSTDGTWSILERMAETDIRVRIFNQENKGRCAARNRGIDQAKGAWICFLDSDDFYYPNHLTAFEEELANHPKEKIMASTLVHQHRLTNRNKINTWDNKRLHTVHFIRTNPISLIQLCVRRDTLGNLRFHEDDLPIAEDWLFIRELTLKSSIRKFNRQTVEVGEHEQRSMNTTQLEKIAHYNIRSSELFVERNALSDQLNDKVLGTGYLLGAHILLQAGNIQEARTMLKKAAEYPVTWFSYRLPWGFFKLVLKSLFIQNQSK